MEPLKTHFRESIPPEGWGEFQFPPKGFTKVLGTLVNLSGQVQDVESAAREHYKIYKYSTILCTDRKSYLLLEQSVQQLKASYTFSMKNTYLVD